MKTVSSSLSRSPGRSNEGRSKRSLVMNLENDCTIRDEAEAGDDDEELLRNVDTQQMKDRFDNDALDLGDDVNFRIMLQIYKKEQDMVSLRRLQYARRQQVGHREYRRRCEQAK